MFCANRRYTPYIRTLCKVYFTLHSFAILFEGCYSPFRVWVLFTSSTFYCPEKNFKQINFVVLVSFVSGNPLYYITTGFPLKRQGKPGFDISHPF